MTATYVQLIDGQVVASDAESWLWECLARHVMRLSIREQNAWLWDYEKVHGPASANELRDTMTALWRTR